LASAPIVTPECIYRGSTRICLPSTPRSSLHSNELIGWRSRTSVIGNPPRGLRETSFRSNLNYDASFPNAVIENP